MKKSLLYQIVLAAIMAALTATIAIFVKIPLPMGYVHPADAIIYLCASLVPTPIAMLSAGIGGALADFIGGYGIYVIPTFIIKAVIASLFTCKNEKIACKRNFIATGIGGALTVILYYIADTILTVAGESSGFSMFMDKIKVAANWTVAFASAPGNLAQAVVSAIVFIALAFALDKANVKKLIK